MITKARLLEMAQQQGLQPTTVEKDHTLGWMLCGVSRHQTASKWVFKGGTCLKKCFFETYRFSEDLDFTIPKNEPFEIEAIRKSICEILSWVESEAGIAFPSEGLAVEQYLNPRGNNTYQVKASFVGPLRMPRMSLQRIKFDLTQDEILVDTPDHRNIYHPYDDALMPQLQTLCYSVNEILAEKTRALFERRGRARDVYDVVHISRAFRDSVQIETAVEVLKQNFSFKNLPLPSVTTILNSIDAGVLQANWEHQLGYQLPVLPDVNEFLSSLSEALLWWMEPSLAKPQLSLISRSKHESTLHRDPYPLPLTTRMALEVRTGGLEQRRSQFETNMSRIIYAARNQLCIQFSYSGVDRIAEPYSLRYPRTGNTLLYVWERMKGTSRTDQIKALQLFKIDRVQVTPEPFKPRFLIEL